MHTPPRLAAVQPPAPVPASREQAGGAEEDPSHKPVLEQNCLPWGEGCVSNRGVPKPITEAGLFLEQEFSQAPDSCPAQAATGMSSLTQELA